MDWYSILREFADSWMLLAMFLFVNGTFLYTLRPGSAKLHRDIANIPFRHEAAPAAKPRRGEEPNDA